MSDWFNKPTEPYFPLQSAQTQQYQPNLNLTQAIEQNIAAQGNNLTNNNNVVVNGITPQVQPQNFNQAIPVSSVYNALNKAYNLKLQYEDNQRLSDTLGNALKNPELQGSQREATQIFFDIAQNNMKDIANTAAMYRNANPHIDFDAYGFGKNNTLQETTQAMANMNARIGNSLYEANDAAWQQVNDVYKNARERGIPNSVAEGMALREKERLSRNLRQQQNEMFVNYGVNEDGSYNRFGLELLGGMIKNPTERAKFYSENLLTPQKKYQLNNATYNNLLGLAAAQDRNAENNYWENVRQAGRLTQAKEIAEMYNKTTRDIANQNYELNVSKHQLEQNKAEIDALHKQWEYYRESSAGQLEEASALANYFYGKEDSPEKTAFIQWHINKYKNPVANDQRYSDVKNSVNNYLQGVIKDNLLKGDFDALKTNSTALKDMMRDVNSDYMKVLKPEDYNEVWATLNFYEQAAEGKIGIFDLYDRIYRMEHPNYVGDPDETPPWYINMMKNRPEEFEQFKKIYAREKGLKSKNYDSTPANPTQTESKLNDVETSINLNPPGGDHGLVGKIIMNNLTDRR